MAKVICYDIDGVCTEEGATVHDDLAGTYIYRRPNLRTRDQMRRAYNQGWTVTLYTGRREAYRRITEDWLHSHGFHYHFLFMDKPYFNYVIDDRGRSLNEFDSLLEIESVPDENKAEPKKDRPLKSTPDLMRAIIDKRAEQAEANTAG